MSYPQAPLVHRYDGNCPHCGRGPTQFVNHCEDSASHTCDLSRCRGCKAVIRPNGDHTHDSNAGCRSPRQPKVV